MLASAILLGVLAVVLAWPVPILLGRAAWPRRAPAIALLLWQSIALAGGLSMIGALLALGLLPFGDTLIRGMRGLVDAVRDGATLSAADALYLLAAGAAVLLAVHLVLNLLLTIVSTERQRRRHRQLVTLLGSPDPARPGTQLIDNAAPIAYCLPGARSITVFSAGLIELLRPDELSAVIAHERAHVSQRHDLLLIAFRAWHMSLPWFPIAYRAEREVGALVEMLADDEARRTAEDATLASAIALVAGARTDLEDALVDRPAMPVATAHQTHDRVRRLLEPRRAIAPALRLGVGVIAVALIAVPTILLLLPVG
ncbi:MAG TPA: M56 family metallopeptidase [Galbitalea sp.]